MTSNTNASLHPRAFEPLPLGAIRPAGWLQNQLRIQAEGLTGHLDEFWPDVADSKWIGGKAEGWERGPYWLDGAVPLAYLLEDERLKAKVQHWIDYIVSHQHEDGWLGPVKDDHAGSGERVLDPWPIFVVLKAMTQYHEATGDERIIPTMQKALRRIDGLLDEKPLESWAKMRWIDFALSIHWLYEKTGDEWLLELARKAQAQGYDWHDHYENFRFPERQPKWLLENHVVNHAMSLKERAVWYRHTGEKAELERARQHINVLDTHHGQVTGVFSGDESLAGRNPSQGTELCAVVEYMFSLEMLVAAFAETAFADRLERITFNALPATFKPDMWAHQYDQQANQVICKIDEDHVYTTNGADANIFGLEPNFGCCTANMHQGWPKFASHLWMQTPDNGLVAVAYAPCTVSTEINGQPVKLEVSTHYPFEETVTITVSTDTPVAFPLSVRIPEWTEQATATVGQEAIHDLEPGTFHPIQREWKRGDTLTLHLPMPLRIQRRYHNSVAIERGPLVYSLPIGEEWRLVRNEPPHGDWEIYPTTAWNYALALDPEQPAASMQFEARRSSDTPFAPDQAPVEVKVKGRRLPQWDIEHNAAAPPPESPVPSDEPEEALTLIPYGCTNLRVTEFPLVAS